MDYEKLRELLLEKCEEMYFAGGIGSAVIDATNIEKASPSELEEYAIQMGITEEDIKKKRLI